MNPIEKLNLLAELKGRGGESRPGKDSTMTIASISKSIAWFFICLVIIGGVGIYLVPPTTALILGAGVGILAGAVELVEGER